MAFSEEVRAELAAALPASSCCRRAMAGAIVRTAGSYHLHGHGDVHVEVELGAGPIARRTVELLRGLGAHVEIRSWSERRFRGQHRFGLVVGPDADSIEVLRQIGVLDRARRPVPEPPARLTGRACCRAAYLRGAFVAGGSVAAPRRGAHLEVRTHALPAAQHLAALAAHDGIRLAVRDRGDHAAAYAKRIETIEDLLALIGAGEAAVRLAEGEVVASARADANRRANADTANLRRQVVAARLQLEAIERLRDGPGLEALPRVLTEAAELRLAHPELSLAELAASASPPLAKPTLSARLRRLVELAEM
jgi:DNA-binding protein WhiA